jgi:hypothetical protein
MRKSQLALLAFSLASLARLAVAAPGDLEERSPHAGVVLEHAGPPCGLRAGLCLHAGPATEQLRSLPVAGIDAAVAVSVTPRYARMERSQDWRIALSGHLRRTSWAGNALFVFFDASDANAMADHRYAALYQTSIPRTTQLAAGLALSPDDGFQPGHTYRLRIAQLIDGKEVVLAETDFALE